MPAAAARYVAPPLFSAYAMPRATILRYAADYFSYAVMLIVADIAYCRCCRFDYGR